MAQVKISQLTPKGAPLSDTDLLAIAEQGIGTYNSKSVTGLNIVQRAQQGMQAELVSGTNIKTIEGQSLLGSGNIDLTKADVGLSNVDDTSDLNKPISTATQTALNAKQDTLVSGTNIKTINGNSVLGSGDLTISGGGGLQGLNNVYGSIAQISQGIDASINAGTSATISTNTNILYLNPFTPNKTITSASLRINVATSGVGLNSRILIYSDLNGFPNTKLYESANLDCSTTGIKTAVTSFTFTAGTTYWFGVHTSGTITLTGISSNSLVPLFSTSASGQMATQFTNNVTFGSAPTTWTYATQLTGTAPRVWIALT